MFTNSITRLELTYWSLCFLRKHVHYPDIIIDMQASYSVWVYESQQYFYSTETLYKNFLKKYHLREALELLNSDSYDLIPVTELTITFLNTVYKYLSKL